MEYTCMPEKHTSCDPSLTIWLRINLTVYTCLSFSPGNVMVHSEMTFHHTYTKLFQDLRELCDNIEDFIILQASVGETDDSAVQIEGNEDSVSGKVLELI